MAAWWPHGVTATVCFGARPSISSMSDADGNEETTFQTSADPTADEPGALVEADTTAPAEPEAASPDAGAGVKRKAEDDDGHDAADAGRAGGETKKACTESGETADTVRHQHGGHSEHTPALERTCARASS